MNRIAELLRQLQRPLPYPYYQVVDLLVASPTVLKARCDIQPDLFVQVYRNEVFRTTNFALMRQGRRSYARDELRGRWHRHLPEAPEHHDTSPAARRAVSFRAFLHEVDQVLRAHRLMR